MNLVFFVSLGLLLIVFQDVDLLSLAESALSKPSPTLFKIKEEITKNNPETKKADWIIGTNWGGVVQWYNAPKSHWYSFVNGQFLISFEDDGRCYILKVGVGDAVKQNVARTESKWRRDGDAIIVSILDGYKNVKLVITRNANKAESATITGFEEQRRIVLNKNWGLKLYPPTGTFKAYSWGLVPLDQRPDHITARP